MKKRLKDDELKEWLKEEVKKENMIMERALFKDTEEKEDFITDEELDGFYEDLMKRMEIQENTMKEEKEISLSERKRKFRHNLAKAAGLVIVCILGVFAASMTSEANRNYFIKSVKYLNGNDTKILIDNAQENDRPSNEEEQARKEIKEKMGMEVPQFMYRPEAFTFYDYMISEKIGVIKLEYLYEENIISFYIGGDPMKSSSSDFSLLEENLETVYMSKENIPVSIVEIKEESDWEPSYRAEWERKNCYYQISGKMPKEKFINLIKEITF